MKGGFEMGNMWYNEPKTIDTACDVLGDIIMMSASMQYGGWSTRVDNMLAEYCEKSYNIYYKEYTNNIVEYVKVLTTEHIDKAKKYAYNKTVKDLKQGIQGLEYKLNSVASSRGDYPFTTFAFGLDKSFWGREVSKAILDVRREGQGKKGFKRPVLFPKLVFLYDENLHDEGKELEDVFMTAIECSSKCMYPDFLSMTGEGYVPSMYKEYGEVVYPMGCRAFLSPWFREGGMYKANENDTPVFTGRFNIGAVTLHLPMILQKSREENVDFYETLDFYLEMIRNIHKRTYDYLGKLRASTNPLGYCEGGFYGGNLKHNDTIESLLPAMTASFGITGLNEFEELYHQKSLVEDGQASLEVMTYINNKVEEFKKADGWLYAIYGTPAESLCFDGETLVQTYEGNKKIKDITTNDLVYSFNENEHKIELKPVLCAKKTKSDANVVEVEFTNGQKLICTPDHPFAIRKTTIDDLGHFCGRETVEYIEAKYLKAGNRVKSNYMHINNFERPSTTICYNGGKQLIQEINSTYYLGEKPDGYVIHHIDKNKSNNKFDNLVYMLDADHRRLHLEDNILKHCFTSESQKGENNSFYGKKHSAESNEKNRKAHLGKAVMQCDTAGNIINIFECVTDAGRSGYTEHAVRQACKGLIKNSTNNGHLYKGYIWNYVENNEENHTVKSVTFLDDLQDVYNIEVADNNNYFVGGDEGILVHNCGLQIKQFRSKYGLIENVSTSEYTSNSFHCKVTEDINPIEKQDYENRFWNLFNGGKIQYVKYPIDYNKKAIITLVRRAMKLGLYEGVNLALSYCNDCGHQEPNMESCTKCGSNNLTKIDRMNGYLSYSRVKGDTTLNDAKMAEIKERKSM